MASPSDCNEPPVQEFKNDRPAEPELEGIISPQADESSSTSPYHSPTWSEVELYTAIELEHTKLHRAILRGDWATAKEIIDNNKDALTYKLNFNGDTAVHIAVLTDKNLGFFKNLLNEINPPELLITTLLNKQQKTALHHAACIGNIKAATMLVEKNKHLLFRRDTTRGNLLPIHVAVIYSRRKIFNYLYDVSKHHIQLSKEEGCQSPFEGVCGSLLLATVIRERMLEEALILMDDYPDIGTSTLPDILSPVESMAENDELYYSGTRYNILQKILYSNIPLDYSRSHSLDMENPGINVVTNVTGCNRSSFATDIPLDYSRSHSLDMENPGINAVTNVTGCNRSSFATDIPLDYSRSHSLDMENPGINAVTNVTGCNRSSFATVIQWIYIKFWRIALLVPQIKQLEKDKVKHNAYATLLKRLCRGVKIERDSDIDMIPDCYFTALYVAVENDIPEVAADVLDFCPQILLRHLLYSKQSVIELAISNRNEKVYNLLVQKNSTINTFLLKTIMDDAKNNLGHLAGKMPPKHKLNLVSGAALQMQRELQWFQEVQKFLRPTDKEAKNKDKQTPIMVFKEEHKELRKEGEEWMKKTADSYTITAALIITIAFAAAITVPGGVNGNSGKAIFGTNPCFIIFVVSDAVSLFTSTTSLLLFLSILTARYSENDFLYKLPKRLIIGLVMLFLSVTSMVIAFSAALFILVGHGKDWILIGVCTLTCLPITSFVSLQFPLLWDLYSSTYGRGIFK